MSPEKTAQIPEQLRRAVELATSAYHAAWRGEMTTAAGFWRAIHTECGDDGIVAALVAMCDTMLAAQDGGRLKPGPSRMVFVSDEGDAAINPARVRPEVAWCGRLVAARAAMDEAAFIAAIDDLPSEPYAVGDHVMELTSVVARTVRGIHEKSLPSADQAVTAAASGAKLRPEVPPSNT